MYNFLSDAEWKGGFASFFQGEQPERIKCSLTVAVMC